MRSKTGGGNGLGTRLIRLHLPDAVRLVLSIAWGLGTRQHACRGCCHAPSQNMGNAPAGVDSAGVSSDEDEQGGKLSSSNMLEQLAKRYQGKPSSSSGIHTRYRVTSILVYRAIHYCHVFSIGQGACALIHQTDPSLLFFCFCFVALLVFAQTLGSFICMFSCELESMQMLLANSI